MEKVVQMIFIRVSFHTEIVKKKSNKKFIAQKKKACKCVCVIFSSELFFAGYSCDSLSSCIIIVGHAFTCFNFFVAMNMHEHVL